ncbi:MAG: hypothetical protein P4L66_14935 [Acetobacteraceae bacterium]|nr:hypothetical protein [Acetobacteraceae bacterium]
MNHHLVVVRPFGVHQKGDVITDAATIASILASPNADHVVRIPAPKEV